MPTGDAYSSGHLVPSLWDLHMFYLLIPILSRTCRNFSPEYALRISLGTFSILLIRYVNDSLRANSRFVKFVGNKTAGRTPYIFYKPTVVPKYGSNRPYNGFITPTTFIQQIIGVSIDSRYRHFTLGIPLAHSMLWRDVNAATRLAEASSRCDDSNSSPLPTYLHALTKERHKTI